MRTEADHSDAGFSGDSRLRLSQQARSALRRVRLRHRPLNNRMVGYLRNSARCGGSTQMRRRLGPEPKRCIAAG